MISSLFKILAAIIKYILSPQYRKRKKEKEKDDYDEAIAENNLDDLSDGLSDSFDRVPDRKGDSNSR